MATKIARFFVTGSLGTITGVALLVFFVEILGLPIILSNSISISIVFFLSFLIHKIWTFKNHSSKFGRQLLMYFFVSLIGLCISNIILYILISQGFWYVYAKIMSVFLVGFWSFLINNFFTFRARF